MEIAFLFTGLLLGFTSAWFIAKGKFRSTGIPAEQYAELDKQKAVAESQVSLLRKENETLSAELKTRTEALGTASDRLARAEEVFKGMQEKIQSQKADFEEKLGTQKAEYLELQKKLTTEFENIANRILDEKSKKFTEQNRTNLDIVLNPLKEKIKSFEDKVEQTYKTDSAERITLKTEIRSLIEMNKQISDEANNLARALKGDNKKQGNWGEIILEKVLERSGLVKGQEYRTQVSTQNDEGKRIQPDVIVYLPDNKHVIIDAKVSLVAYEALVNADSEEEKEPMIREHLRSMREHIKGLSEKNYQSSADFNTPDLVMLFVPIESSFSVAVQADQELFSFAWERKIVIVSPSTLLASLKTIASLWKQERQTRNALEIAREGGALYDKFEGFIRDMDDIGNRLGQTRKSYDDAMSKLTSGPGNLVRRIEKLKELGAKASKTIPEKFTEPATVAGQGITLGE